MSITKEHQLIYIGKLFTQWPFPEDKWTFSTETLGAISNDADHHVITVDEWRKSRNSYLERHNRTFDQNQLPRVGAVCLAHITSENKWVEIEVVANRDGYVLGWCVNEKCGYHGNEASDFKPLPTERDKAITHLESLVSNYGEDDDKTLGYISSEIARRIYDAGYHK